METSPDAGRALWEQVVWLFVLALPVATVAWTITHEELFKEPREWCTTRSTRGRSVLERKFFYAFTCEYCFSHYVAAGAVAATGYRLLLVDWRGAVIAWFALVAIANVYMSLFARVRVEIKAERLEIQQKERENGPTSP
jgi:hypothetical protein